MTSNIQIGNFKPKIEVDVVLFASLVGSVIFTAGTSDNEELIVKTADGVSVAGILKFIHSNAVESVSSVVDDLVALLQRGRSFIDLTATN